MTPRTAAPVEKIMALSPDDFRRSVAALAPLARMDATGTALCDLGAGKSVTISYEALTGVKLGKLLDMPRARVTITFDGLGDTEKSDFLARFDRAFQRGGG
ncbi:MAG: hypothetical protein VX871_08920 [Pseudomonadota bacterium]|nr:hypothetical protein [Pseudomonadota bacterium]